VSQNFQFALLENGLDSIASAIEHLEDHSKRSLKRAVRDLWQGVELVLKERLHREHWSLVFEHLNKANVADYKVGDFVSVSFDSCVERLRGVCGIQIAKAEVDELKRFQKMRNRLEHFGIDVTYDAVVGSAGSGLDIVVEFIHNHLSPDELDGEAAALMEEIAAGVLKLEAYIEQRMKKLEPELKAVKTIVMTCPTCSQDALVIDGGAECLFCHYEAEGVEAAEDYVDRVLGVSFKERADLGLCPECDLNTVVDLENGGNQYPATEYVCFNCGESWLEGSFTECSSCARLFYDDEDGVGVCSDCWDARLRND